MAEKKLQWLSYSEVAVLEDWLEDKPQLPEQVLGLLTRLITVYVGLAKVKTKSSATLARLREAMGISPKSESSRNAIGSPVISDRKKLARLRAQKKGINQAIKKFEATLKTQREAKKLAKQKAREVSSADSSDEQAPFARPSEDIFSGSFATTATKEVAVSVDREVFDNSRGLHSVKGKRGRKLVNTTVTQVTYHVETVTDPRTGKTVTASMDPYGPPGYEVTWCAISNIIMMAVGYAFPINRIAKILLAADSYFTSGRITELILYGAKLAEPVYTTMGESLAESEVLSGDDTSTRVLEMEKLLLDEKKMTAPPKSKLVARIAEVFGRISKTKDGKRPQRRYQVSVLTGKTNPLDRRSYIYFFHSHLGHLGNLLTRILGMRKPSHKKVVIQSDLSTSNRPDNEICNLFDITFAGCMAHARRPFFRHRFDDPMLCFTLLRAFQMLSNLELRLDNLGRTRERVERYRQRYALRIWEIIYEYAESVVEGNPIAGEYWPKETPIRAGCEYIVNNFAALTQYCYDPRLDLTNNLRERLLRWDKIMLDSSKFRKTEQGRAAINILRTLVHTCSAAEVEPKKYMTWMFQNFRDLDKNPEKYTPYAYALSKP